MLLLWFVPFVLCLIQMSKYLIWIWRLLIPEFKNNSVCETQDNDQNSIHKCITFNLIFGFYSEKTFAASFLVFWMDDMILKCRCSTSMSLASGRDHLSFRESWEKLIWPRDILLICEMNGGNWSSSSSQTFSSFCSNSVFKFSSFHYINQSSTWWFPLEMYGFVDIPIFFEY